MKEANVRKMGDKKQKHKSKEKKKERDHDRHKKRKQSSDHRSKSKDRSRDRRTVKERNEDESRREKMVDERTRDRIEAKDRHRNREKTRSRSRSKSHDRSRYYGHSSSYKSPHSSCHDRDHSKYRSSSSSPPSSERYKDEEDATNLVYFSFLDFKSELTKVLTGYTTRDRLVNDVEDFWMFVNKYETTLRNAGKTILPEPVDDVPDEDSSNKPNEMNSTDTTNTERLKFSIPFDNLYARLSSYDRIHKLSEKKVKQFLRIVLQYLDFLQHDKLMKIKKLQKVQAELPVAKYKEEIIAAVAREQVVLIAGDTGCGMLNLIA